MAQHDGTVDISEKGRSARMARARTALRARPEVVDRLLEDRLDKSDPLPTARAAAMLAVKRTPDTLPHCHPIDVTDITVEFEPDDDEVVVLCTVRAADRTGPDMEALTGASTAALTLYDMVKGICPEAVIGPTQLMQKEGGRTGHWKAEDADE